MTEVAHEVSLEVGDRGEHAASDYVALDLADPPLDLVERRGIGRSEAQVNPRKRD